MKVKFCFETLWIGAYQKEILDVENDLFYSLQEWKEKTDEQKLQRVKDWAEDRGFFSFNYEEIEE